MILIITKYLHQILATKNYFKQQMQHIHFESTNLCVGISESIPYELNHDPIFHNTNY